MFDTIVCLNVNPDAYAPTRFKEETQKMGLNFISLNIPNLLIEIDKNNLNLYADNKKIDLKKSAFIIRSLSIQGQSDTHFFKSFINFLVLHEVRILNKNSILSMFFQDKLSQNIFYAKNGLASPRPSVFSGNSKTIINYDFNYPIIAKPKVGSHGRGIIKIDSQQDLVGFVEKEEVSQYIFQKYIKADFDIRAFVCPFGIIGAMKRQGKKGFIHNVSQGAKTEIIELDQEAEKICLDLQKITKSDIIGVDLIFNEDDQQYYTLEADYSNQFTGFEQATKFNMARLQLDLLLEKDINLDSNDYQFKSAKQD